MLTIDSLEGQQNPGNGLYGRRWRQLRLAMWRHGETQSACLTY